MLLKPLSVASIHDFVLSYMLSCVVSYALSCLEHYIRWYQNHERNGERHVFENREARPLCSVSSSKLFHG
jgi:hypothetical protein